MRPTRLVGGKTHNLKNVSLELAPGELVALVGVSGAGKSSLAMDTLYAEGQRRFIESFSPYARQFLERLERPPVESLDPVAAGIAVDRRAPVKSSRSTVATMADLEPYLSALFTREARPVCPTCGVTAVWTDPTVAAERVAKALAGGRAIVTYPKRTTGTADYLEVRDALAKDGYRRLLVGGVIRDVDEVAPSEIDAAGSRFGVVIDRLDGQSTSRLRAALEEAWRRGTGTAEVVKEGAPPIIVARGLACPSCAKTFEPARPSLFSYQSPVGACSTCRGFGRTIGIDWAKVFPNHALTLKKGAIRPWSGKSSEWERGLLSKFCSKHRIPMDVPWGKLEAAQRAAIVQGDGSYDDGKFPGVQGWFRWLEQRTYKMHVRVLLSRYRAYETCETCHGQRLNETALAYRVAEKNLAEWHELEIDDLGRELTSLKTDTGQGELVRRELASRIAYLARVGLGYLTLDRQARTLSGGEGQRVSLTAALGTALTGALFVLDEPTVGLHATDAVPLADAMRELADRGNAVLVLEHDPDIISGADRVIELGPGAGPHGGQVLFDGAPADLAKVAKSPTGEVLAARKKAPVDRARRAAKGHLTVQNAREHNLRGVTVDIPLGVLCAITGPSGSGKSTLIRDIVYRTLAKERGLLDEGVPGQSDGIVGARTIREIALVDQAPLGRTSRGNAATYTKAWDRIRAIYANETSAQKAGLTAGDFSFNVPGGRCEACSGEGYETIEMQFLADVSLLCAACRGRRFTDRVLGVRVNGRSVADLLAASVSEVIAAFPGDKTILRTLGVLETLGLGYLALGQPLSTLSGGEAQRLKLARALSSPWAGTLFVLDEPSAGLHEKDVGFVLGALDHIVDGGGSVLVVEHDRTVVERADWVIDLGPGAGKNGGLVVAEGTPEMLRKEGVGKTADALRTREARSAGRKKIERAPAAEVLRVEHAREHNLHDVSCDLPLGKLVVLTGPSGSGKSTLAFDVVFAEGQRRFLETLTPYARQFLPMMPRPDVDRVLGVPPSIALEQRTGRAGANSTVATVTEIAHYLRLLYAKVGQVHCPSCDAPVTSLEADAVFARVRREPGLRTLLAPAVTARKGTYLDVFTSAARAGFPHAICDGERVSTDRPPLLKKTQEHTIAIVIAENQSLSELPRATFDHALELGEGAVTIAKKPTEVGVLLSTRRSCARCGTSVPELDPRWFSFNTKQGQCPTCEGSGKRGETDQPCGTCKGARLAPLPRGVRLGGHRYHELMAQPVDAARKLVGALTFEGDDRIIAEAAHKEVLRRFAFLEDVGLSYLSLGRAAQTLSGGEMQRLRLSAQVGSGLTGALYVLDEPTIGLHPRDTHRLLQNLRALVDGGSTVLVVEHDIDTIRAADHLIDLGPSGGIRGGRIIAEGKPDDVLAAAASPTGQALRQPFSRPRAPRGPATETLVLKGATEHNLQNVTLRVPHGRFVVACGVSGSGKSTLVRKVLLPAVRRALKLETDKPGAFAKLEGIGTISRAIAVDQSPIGRTPRSVPATFLGIWDEIRRVYAASPEAQIRGYQPARFSFNTSGGGRCPVCDGQGVITHEMSFLPDVVTPCEACLGMRFEPETLSVKWLDRSIGEVLRMSASEAAVHFAAHKKIAAPLRTIEDLGVGYLQLGQGSHTLSGGEAQRLKLAAELTAGSRHEPTLYVLDEPTTGLHLGDVAKLLEVLSRLVDRGDTLVVIEHHPYVLAAADYLVELGPDGGDKGGVIVAEGTPEEVAKGKTASAPMLRELLGTASGRRKSARGS